MSSLSCPDGGSDKKSMVILETVDAVAGVTRHYLLPDNVKAKKLKQKGIKLHLSQHHVFAAQRIKRSVGRCHVDQQQVFDVHRVI